MKLPYRFSRPFLLFFTSLLLFSCEREDPEKVKEFQPFFSPYSSCQLVNARIEMGADSHWREFSARPNPNDSRPIWRIDLIYDNGKRHFYEVRYYGNSNIERVLEDSVNVSAYDYPSGVGIANPRWIRHYGNGFSSFGNRYDIFEYNSQYQLLRKKFSHRPSSPPGLPLIDFKKFEYAYDAEGRVSVKREYSIDNDIPTLLKTYEYAYYNPVKKVSVNLGPLMPETEELSLKNGFHEPDLFYVSAIKEIDVSGAVNHYTYEYKFNLQEFPVKITKKKNGNVVYTIGLNYNNC